MKWLFDVDVDVGVGVGVDVVLMALQTQKLLWFYNSGLLTVPVCQIEWVWVKVCFYSLYYMAHTGSSKVIKMAG